jgi:hypothetical protein
MSEEAFKYSKSLLSTKTYNFDDKYDAMFNNKILSQHGDCILHTNAMNLCYRVLSPRQQYDYYFYTIRPVKRKFNKWGKKKDDEKVKMVMEYFNYSYRHAYEVVDLLTKDQIKEIKDAV